MSRETDLKEELKQLVEERRQLLDALKKNQENQLASSKSGGSLDTIDNEAARILTRIQEMEKDFQRIRRELKELEA